MSAIVETAASIIRRARKRIQQHRWSPIDEGTRLCIYSALGLVVFGRGVPGLSNDEMAALDGTVRYVLDAIGSAGGRVFDWELLEGRTEEDVLDALQRAADLADWELGPEAA